MIDGSALLCCPGCGAGRRQAVLLAAGKTSVIGCPACGLAYTWPTSEEGGSGPLYPPAYYTHQPVQWKPGRSRLVRSLVLHRYYGYPLDTRGLPGLAALVLWPLQNYWRTIPPAVPGGSVLDAGCGNGLYLARLRALGWSVSGLEPDAAACALARRLDVPVVCADLHANAWPDNSFDVVTFWHSLEHMTQPQRALEIALALLRPGGLLMLEVPNWASVQRRLFGKHWFHLDLPRHRVHFSPASLSLYLTRSGFQHLHVSTIPSPVGISGSLEQLLSEPAGPQGWRHNRALKALAWAPEAVLSRFGQGGCIHATARKA
jgi:SAM-dependent methyltransferase